MWIGHKFEGEWGGVMNGKARREHIENKIKSHDNLKVKLKTLVSISLLNYRVF